MNIDCVNIGIVGTGKLGSYHIQKLQKINQCNLIGVYDLNQDLMQKISQRYDVNIFNNINLLFEKCDAVIISTPTTTHFDIAKKALNKGLHVFIEKPISDNIVNAVKIADIAKKNKKIVQIGHIERFNIAFTEALKYIDNPQFIEIHRISPFPNRSLDVPVVMDLMIHDLDILSSIAIDGEIKEIHATGSSVITDFVDLANARVEYKNGLVVNLTASRVSSRQMRKIRVFQPSSYIGIDLLDKKLDVYSISKNNSIDSKSIQLENVDALNQELLHFIDSIIKDRRPLVDVYDGIKALKLALRIEELICKKEEEK